MALTSSLLRCTTVMQGATIPVLSFGLHLDARFRGFLLSPFFPFRFHLSEWHKAFQAFFYTVYFELSVLAIQTAQSDVASALKGEWPDGR